MEKQWITSYVKAVDTEARTLMAYASTGDLDRDDEVIRPEAWDATIRNFERNPVFLWAHDYRIPPIGKAKDLGVDARGLRFTAQFAKTDFANEIWELYRDGYLNAFSVGFIPRKWEDANDQGDEGKAARRTFTEVELLEISAVPVPANPYATVERGIPVLSIKSPEAFTTSQATSQTYILDTADGHNVWRELDYKHAPAEIRQYTEAEPKTLLPGLYKEAEDDDPRLHGDRPDTEPDNSTPDAGNDDDTPAFAGAGNELTPEEAGQLAEALEQYLQNLREQLTEVQS